MKLQLRLKLITKLLVLWLFFFSFAPLQALATPYGGCAYGGDSRVDNCLQSSTSSTITQPFDKSFFDEKTGTNNMSVPPKECAKTEYSLTPKKAGQTTILFNIEVENNKDQISQKIEVKS